MHREARISNYVLTALTGVSLILLSLPLSTPVESFKATLSYALDPALYYGAKGAQRLAEVPSGIRQLLGSDMENRVMREEVREAALVRSEAESLRKENQRLREELGLKAPAGRVGVWVRVIERDHLHWYRSLIVDAGAERGVSLNAPVLGPSRGVLVAVGRVIEVNARTSVVLLLTDEPSSLAAYLSSGTVDGLVQGQGGAHLRMNYISPEAVIADGDRVYTSPASVTFPPDILIGVVTRILPRNPLLTFQSVEIDPAAEAAALDELLILTPRGERFRPPPPPPEGEEGEPPEDS